MAVDRYVAMSLGWDVPGAWLDASDYSLLKLHVRSLRLLMHSLILQRRWQAAYKVLTVLLRFEFVDKRAIWPLALEIILQRKLELLKQRKLPKTEMNKETQFLEWILLCFPIGKVPFFQLRSYLGPVYRTGSRTHAPMSIITGLWNLLVDQRFTRVREDLDDLLLHPPYSSDGAFLLLLAMCCLAENNALISLYKKFDECGGFFDDSQLVGDLANEPGLTSSKETLKTRILNNNAQVRKMLEQCEKLKFEVPKQKIEAQLIEAWQLLGLQTDLEPPEITRDTLDTEKSHNNEWSLKSGLITQANDSVNVIPEKFLYRFVKAATVFDPKWFNELYTKSNLGKFSCRVCGDAVLEASATENELVSHLKTHGVSEINWNQYGPSPVTMAEMVKEQDPTLLAELENCQNGNLLPEAPAIVENADTSIAGQESSLSASESEELPQQSAGPSTLGAEKSDQSEQSDSSEANSRISSPENLLVATPGSEEEDDSDEHTNKKGFFSPTSSLPTQDTQNISTLKDYTQQRNDNTDSLKFFGEEEWVTADNNAGEELSDDGSTRFEDALESQRTIYPDLSDSEGDNDEFKPKKKKQKSQPLEMDFDFDFD